MAVQAFATTELGADYRGTPVNDHGKLRLQFFALPATTVAGDATSTVDLCRLPSGKVRVLPNLSRITNSAFGAARVLDIGHTAYQSRDDNAVAYEPANPNALANDIDVAAAHASGVLGTVDKYDFYSKSGVLIQAVVAGGTIPIGATLTGYIAYIYE